MILDFILWVFLAAGLVFLAMAVKQWVDKRKAQRSNTALNESEGSQGGNIE